MERTPELEAMRASDDAPIRDSGARRNQVLGGAALLLLGLLAAYFVLTTGEEAPQNITDGDETFRTTTYRPPSYVRDKDEPVEEPPDDDIVQLPPPPAPPPVAEPQPDTTEFNPPPPPPVQVPAVVEPPVPEPTIVMVEPEPAQVDVFPSRYASKLVVLDSSGSDDSLAGAAGADGEGGPTVAGEDSASKFLAAAAAIGDRSARARQLDRIDALVPEGTMIPGILETAVNSDLPGQMRAVVSENVYSLDGRRILIPKSTRLIGEYQSEITRGQERIFVVWTRLIRSDGVSVRLNSIGADSLGRSGITGHVDRHFRERFGSAILLSVVGAGASYLTGYGSDSASSSEDSSEAEELARETIAETFSDMANQALGESLRIKPTISVPQGERIFVYVRQDLDFSALYDDPVTEALKQIKKERGLE
ncbi:type IV secretion system protein VirB10 [Notoacmeibacter sp. MSK16QG-6]|uniref:type IV secretion system protein VirB10 n=1 Tax=Notoacmeibacter sp. MSK16QG-6 TaxID=2957982 RepID=UPI00209CDC79|nr:type IV secretion system protein VirB10 [Notoacmeibacter sp. MSK16QG-6]MCP1201106.1 type IV secretion system protein VirB10 [Notoacmeibacter sp. MSK16QG-6]